MKMHGLSDPKFTVNLFVGVYQYCEGTSNEGRSSSVLFTGTFLSVVSASLNSKRS